ncbi:hypothetical protein [Candidatus Finniella inopinata]|uniref:hypothetical protein n=1 Tax=Candidatus Finniella inopinata TaxID=1696036 RepID=UPI0013EE8E37|nr:hypothetical protein [Candidatus Finniella inopinata]
MCVWGVVDLQTTPGGTNYAYGSIHEALTTGLGAHTTTTPILTFTAAADTVETQSVSLDSFAGFGKSVTIAGASGGTTIIPAPTLSGSLFSTSSNNALTLNLSSLTFTGFSYIYSGSVLSTSGALTLNSTGTNPVTFTGNSSNGQGGAIYTSRDVTLTDTQFINNTATRYSGGAVHTYLCWWQFYL